MGTKNLKSITDPVTLHTKAQKTSTQSIQGTEIAGFRNAYFAVDIGDWTADGLTVTFQDSDDNSEWADITDANLDGQANDIAIKHGHADSVLKVDYLGNKRYIGAKITDAANGDAVVGVYVVKGFPGQTPYPS